MALPINSILLNKAEVCDIREFKANPAIKAPIIGSTPATSDKKAAKKITESTKI